MAKKHPKNETILGAEYQTQWPIPFHSPFKVTPFLALQLPQNTNFAPPIIKS